METEPLTAAETVWRLMVMMVHAEGKDRESLANAIELLRTHALPVSDPLAIE